MENKGINPIFVSGLDILTGALGVFIVLNFLHARTPQAPPPQPQAQVTKSANPQNKTGPNTTQPPGTWWRRLTGTNSSRESGTHHVQTAPTRPTTPTSTPTQPGTTQTQTSTTEPPKPTTPQSSQPVMVDLLKSTKGVATILLQQADRSKSSVEFMLRQGSRTWKPTRSSKYQNEVWDYERRLTYFYQNTLQPGTYEVLVRVKRGSQVSPTERFALYGKIITGGGTETFSFGTYAIGGGSKDWTPAGTFTVGGNSLSYRSRLTNAPVAPGGGTTTTPTTTGSSNEPAVTQAPTTTPTTTRTPATKKRNSKWD